MLRNFEKDFKIYLRFLSDKHTLKNNLFCHQIEYDKEQKGPISALEHVEGYLVTAMGQKVWMISCLELA